MSTLSFEPLQLLIRKLNRLTPLDSADRAALMQLKLSFQTADSSQTLVRQGDLAERCCLLVEGSAFRYKLAANGGRQIVSFHVPGDLLDVQHLLLPRADHSVQTVANAVVAVINATDLRNVMRTRPRVGDALWRESLVDASIFREWVLNVGRRCAKTRVAHMLCEFATKLQSVGLGAPERFDLPMSQELIADATGLTPIHVNRMLRALTEDGVIERDKREVRIVNWSRMQKVAEFKADYLHHGM